MPVRKGFHHTRGRKDLSEVQVDSFRGLSKHLGVDRLKTCRVSTCLPTSRCCMDGGCFNAEIDTLDRLHPSRFFYGSVESLTSQLVSLIPHSEEILLECKSDFFSMRRNSFSSQIFQCNILLPSSLLQVDSLNAGPRRDKISMRCTSTKAFFQVLISVLLQYCISSYSHLKWFPQTFHHKEGNERPPLEVWN